MRNSSLIRIKKKVPARRLLTLCLLAVLISLLPARSASAGPATRIQSVHLYADPTNDLVSGLCPPPSQEARTQFFTSDHNMMVALRFANLGASQVFIAWLAPNGRLFTRDRVVTSKAANPYCSEIGIDDTDAQNININPVGQWTVEIEIGSRVVRVKHFTVSRPPSS
jgi:hypothetical protein